jgi:hypothetical protein
MLFDLHNWSFGLRPTLTCAAAVCATAAITFAQAPPAATPESIKRAEEVLAAARKALGGDKLAEVKTVVATGRTRRVRGDNLVPIEFQLLLELPDKYLRIDEFPAEDTDPTSSGFTGDALIQIPPLPAGPPPGARAGGPGPGGPAGGPPPGAPAAGGGAAATQKPAPETPPSAAGGRANPPAPGAAAAGGGTPATQKPAPETPPSAAATPPPPGGAPAPMPGADAGPGRGMPPGAAGRGMMPPGGRGPAMDPRRARLLTVKQDYARLALGLFAASSGYPLTFSYAAIAEAPQGRADVLDAKGEGNFTLRYFINSETHLPVMVTWTTPPTNVIVTVPGQPPPKTVAPGAVVVPGPAAPAAGAPKEEMDKYAKEVVAIRAKAQATPVEHRLYFADYRDVDGLRLPFRLRRAIGAETTEETTFDRFRINTKIDPRKFTPVK